MARSKVSCGLRSEIFRQDGTDPITHRTGFVSHACCSAELVSAVPAMANGKGSYTDRISACTMCKAAQCRGTC